MIFRKIWVDFGSKKESVMNTLRKIYSTHGPQVALEYVNDLSDLNNSFPSLPPGDIAHAHSKHLALPVKGDHA